MALRRGFKAESNRLAIEMRAELGLRPTSPLDPRRLADHLDIDVTAFSSVREKAPLVDVLLGPEQEAVSALTVHAGTRRSVFVNDAHSHGRQNSSIAHELAHALLLHAPGPALDPRGCRHWNGEIEEEANWLGGNLLLTNEAARAVVRWRLTEVEAMERYEVSSEMLRWRINVSGARRVYGRSA